MKASHEEAQYRPGLLGKRCGNCAMFRDMDLAVHEGNEEGGEPAAERESEMRSGEELSRQGRDEYDAAHDPSEPPPSCTMVVGPIAIRDQCDYFAKRT